MTDVLLFDSQSSGHHVEFMQWLVEGWLDRPEAGRLVVVGPPPLIQALALLSTSTEERVTYDAIPPDRLPAPTQSPRAMRRVDTDLFLDAIARHRPRHALAMVGESLLAALARRAAVPSPARVSGILFRPSFHYTALGSPPDGVVDRAKRLVKAALLGLAARHPSVDALFTLDPEAAEPARRWTGSTSVVPLLDPLPSQPHVDRAKARTALCETYGLDPDRRLAVLFGSLEIRKGVYVLLDALERLPPTVADELAILLAGRIPPLIADIVQRRAEQVRARSTTQLIIHDAFVSEPEAAQLTSGADLALLPYQKHVGSSGVLIRSAAANVPVLAQDYGLMGYTVRTYRLGRTIDSTSPERLAQALAEDWPAAPDPDGRAAFLRGRTPEQFAATVFDTLLP